MRAVNLLPRDEKPKRTRAQNAPIAVGLGLGLVATVAIAFMFLRAAASVHDKASTLADAKAQLAVLPPLPPGPTATETQLASQQKARVAALTSALSKRVAWDRVLRELAIVLPSDVWLTSLSAKSPSSPASAAPAAPTPPNAPPTGFVLTGATYSQDAVARLLSRLQVLPDLHNVQLQTSAISQIGTQNVVEFTIIADVAAPGATS